MTEQKKIELRLQEQTRNLLKEKGKISTIYLMRRLKIGKKLAEQLVEICGGKYGL